MRVQTSKDSKTGVKGLLLNATTSYAKHFLSVISLALLIPYIINHIGVEQFGLWSLVYSIIGFLGLLEMGLGVTSIRFIAHLSSLEELKWKQSEIASLFYLHFAAALLCLICVSGLSFCMHWVFDISADLLSVAIVLLWLLASQMLLIKIPLEIFRNLLYGRSRITLINGIQACSFTLYILLILSFFSAGQTTIIALAVAALLSMLFEFGVYIGLTYRYLPRGFLSVRHVNWQISKGFMEFSVFASLANVATVIKLQSDTIIVGLFSSLSVVGLYALALKLATQSHFASKLLVNVLMPEFGATKSSSDLVGVISLAVKWSTAVALSILITSFFLAVPLLGAWVGSEFHDAALIWQILMIAVVVSAVKEGPACALLMQGHHRQIGLMSMAGAILNLLLSWLLAWSAGATGVAVATVVALCFVDLPYTILQSRKEFGLTVRQLFKASLMPLLFPGLLQALCLFSIQLIATPQGLIQNLLLAALGGLVFFVGFLSLSLSDSEKVKLTAGLRRFGRFVTKTKKRPGLAVLKRGVY